MVEVVFGLDKSGDRDSRETDVLRLVLGTLSRIPGDAIFHYQYTEVYLLRRDGRLTVNGSLLSGRTCPSLTTRPKIGTRMDD